MKTPNNSNTANNKKLLLLCGLVVAVAASVTVGIMILGSKKVTTNYAQDVARPLEQGLQQAGGVRKCTLSSSGHTELTGSNATPWYQVYYELNQPREQAKTTVMKIAADNGYNLKQATLENRGPVPVADTYINDWLYNTSDKKSSFTDLEPGNISLFAQVMNTPGSYTCDNGESVMINAGATTSTVRWDVKLPSFRR